LTLRTPSPETADALKTVPGVVSIFQEPSTDGQVFMVECELGRDIRTELAAQAVRRGWGLIELAAVKLSLEDVFLHLTREESNPEEPKESVLKGEEA
jgi:ABC-2 type transport system ATP-binding protein